MRQITNRAVIIVRPKAPFIDWIRSDDDESKHITAEAIAEEPNVLWLMTMTWKAKRLESWRKTTRRYLKRN